LQPDPDKRISAKEALQHNWITVNNLKEPINKSSLINLTSFKVKNKLNQAIIQFIANQLIGETEK